MKFTALLFAALLPFARAASIPESFNESTEMNDVPVPIDVSPPGANPLLEKRDKTCSGGDASYGHAVQLRNCVNWFANEARPGFGTWSCAGKTFRITGGGGWASAADCKNGCTSCLRRHANNGHAHGSCDKREGFASCSFNYS
ncbi:hypothetical protein BS50DRAFT_55783 [Corynespora cassiicola Philippines]|uniref:Uncharacterized protein n=1 Tax=Corynespora cassiicola Philippines TaxID=1448308 RepID=A0A2T2NIS7_CORCC|nr:hypothetical protein BS50DRAFT_55783 [Corynespora cassiicola Philippines]